jgi:predicted regulator of Ras-like GTPase activity (Roadblock/LC7/MglB family)
VSTDALSAGATNFNWLLDNFVESSAGVYDAVAVSSDGLLIAMSHTLDRESAERVAAVISGLFGLSRSAARAFRWEPVHQVVVAMQGGYLLVSSISEGAILGTVAGTGCDIGLVGYQTKLLVEKIGALLSPALVAHLRAQVLQLR